MKDFLKKHPEILLFGGFLILSAGQYYPDETATDNFIAAGFDIVSALLFVLAAISFLMNLMKK